MKDDKEKNNHTDPTEERWSTPDEQEAQSDPEEIAEVSVDELADPARELLPSEGLDGRDKKYSYILTGMYKSWFLSYASYVILERAVPHIIDGLKPVQRRVLFTMSQMDDRLTKVANIVGQTMMLHPHGDASITDALVQLGQKELLIDCQGNWGNIFLGDRAAAARYIEARLLPFAKRVLFSPKITEYKPSYDATHEEPVYLPVKFPLLLALGAEGIAVGLSSKILPHNVCELLEACIAHLKGESFELYPDFITGGMIDVSRYNDGKRGGALKVRANIIKKDSKTLVIDELPFSRTTETLIDSILKANDNGKIKIRSAVNKTAEKVHIEITLAPGTSPDKTIDALYAFSDCEINLYPNCCVIRDDKPHFLNVSEVLRDNTSRTMMYLHDEQKIELLELEDKHTKASLEELFITRRVYKDKAFEEAKNITAAIAHIRSRLEDALEAFDRKVTNDDLKALLEIKMARILRFNEDKNQKYLASLEKDMERVKDHLAHIKEFTIAWYQQLLDDYGDQYPRRTKIQNFDSIDAVKVVEKNEKLYVNRAEGFIGTNMKKDEYVCNVSSIDEVIVFLRNGEFSVVKVADKLFVGKEIIHVARFVRNDKRTIYNAIYRDGKNGTNYIKRFAVPGVVRDRTYFVTQGKPGSRILYFSANPNGEAETVRIVLKPKPRQKQLVFEKDFSEILIKGRGAQGNILTKGDVFKITLKQKGVSTLGGRMVWFDHYVCRINYDERGEFLGEFSGDDKILVMLQNGDVYLTNFAETNRYEREILLVEKYDPSRIWTLIYYDSEQEYTYIKRFTVDDDGKRENMMGSEANELITLSGENYPMFEVAFAGPDEHRLPITVDADEYIGVKSIRAKGKRLSNYKVGEVEEQDPKEAPASAEEEEKAVEIQGKEEESNDDSDETYQLIEEATGQKRLPFDDNKINEQESNKDEE